MWRVQVTARPFRRRTCPPGRPFQWSRRPAASSRCPGRPPYPRVLPAPGEQARSARPGLKLDDIDVFEVNEAFAAQALAVVRELGLPPDRTNPNGSGISLGHPIGATGAILVVKALYELRRTGGCYGPVTMCIGGGQGIAAVFERA